MFDDSKDYWSRVKDVITKNRYPIAEDFDQRVEEYENRVAITRHAYEMIINTEMPFERDRIVGAIKKDTEILLCANEFSLACEQMVHSCIQPIVIYQSILENTESMRSFLSNLGFRDIVIERRYNSFNDRKNCWMITGIKN